ncbi:MAG: EpsI family protein [Candidatus Latescibacteria bacterium]|nr:EpsI family protein [Candidatus Latescibacterota bacterium]NIO00951.1 EpsI family protein [Candidatus Latescibacterota bacterium]NIO27350.1 EpsI family protein [Candidatus Latescibacterota bacterium]NIO54872.1 EpsI family protein [Candidatus Latescibacterota bacterium]NIT00961.1 EpsI family protein [Candidatus Latescibacterota bacterium]
MRWRIYSLLLLLVVLTPYAYLLRFTTVAASEAPSPDGIPYSINGYIGSDEYLGPGTLQVLGADETIFRVYKRTGGRKIWFFLGYFSAAQENSQIHSPKHCYPGSGWNVYEEGAEEIEIAHRRRTIKRLYITNGVSRRMVLYWFATRSGLITNEFSLKWDQMKNSLLRRPQSTAFVRFSAEIAEDEGEERTLVDLLSFVEGISPHVVSALEGPLGGSSGNSAGEVNIDR